MVQDVIGMDRKDKRRILLYTVFGIILAIRLINISNPPLDYSSWRQVDTDSIARNFLEYKFNIFYPQLNYDGPMPNYVQLEFQLTTFIIAILYKIFGVSYILGRMVPIAFFMGSCFFLYRLVKIKSGINTALMAVLIYGTLPINVIYSRNIMPESAMLFFTVGALYYYLLWTDYDRLDYYILAAAFTTFAILTKFPAALIGIPMIYLSIKKYGIKVFKVFKLYLFPIFTLCLPMLYFYWLGTVAEQRFVSDIGSNMILPNFINSIFKKETLKYLSEQFALKVITVPGAILFAFGVMIQKRKEESFYYVWLIACLFHVFLVDAVIHLDYYLMFITPAISVFMAYTAVKLFTYKRFQYFLYISLLIIFLNSAVLYKDANKVQYHYIVFGNYIASNTNKDDLIIIDRDSPELFYTSGRKGWRLYNDLMTVENIKTLISNGARYLAISQDDKKEDVIKDIDKNYKKTVFPEGYCIYKLY